MRWRWESSFSCPVTTGSGPAGPYKFTANEVAIGLTMPLAAVEICRQRLAPAQLNRAVALADVFSPDEALVAGFLDRVVAASEVRSVSQRCAADLAKLDIDAHVRTKLRLRAPALQAIRAGIEADDAALRASA